jgi:hypothetical protein
MPLHETPPRASPDDHSTGVPGLHTWRGVYLFVLGCFILWLGLLVLFTWSFR